MTSEKPLCPICSYKSKFFESAENLEQKGKKVFNLYKCDFCGHGFFYPGVENAEELHQCYDEDYAKNYNPEIKNDLFLKRKEQYELDLNFLKKFLMKEDIAVLDFGCSTGQFLNIMPPTWKKSGFEINKFERDYISKNYKEIELFSDLSQLKKNSYDLITLRGVIEHLFDFKELFSIINYSLKEKGIVYICATPDFNSPCSSVYRTKWNQISAPYHYHQFTASSIAILFAKNGFGLKEMEHQYIKTPYANFEEDAVKFIKNVGRVLDHKELVETSHAYPGTMMSMIFEKIVI